MAISQHPATLPTLPWYRQAGKVVTAVASTGAAFVSIVSFLYSYGVLGDVESRRTVGNLGAAWVGVRPAVDTLTAIGDTLHLAATITDRNGAVLVGARPAWTTAHPTIATVLPSGAVVARGAGETVVTLAVGDHFARARVIVRPLVASVEVRAASGDTGLVVAETGSRQLRAWLRDSRGHGIERQRVQWSVDDTTIARVDSTGMLVGLAPGRAIVTATANEVSAHAAITVAATPAAITAISGASQRGVAGAPLPQRVVVRVTSRRGRPVESTLVRFRLPSGGAAEPAASLTDAEGRARTTWKLGDMPGRQILLASVADVDSALSIAAEVDPAPGSVRVLALAGGIVGHAGNALPAPVAVRLTDTAGRALPDVAVSWIALDGGSVAPLAPRTDSLGEVRANWTLGGRTGTHRLRAQVGSGSGSRGVAPAVLTASARAGAPTTVAIGNGDAQHGIVGSTLARPIVVRVLDARGNGVGDVRISVAPNAGSVLDTAVMTDSLGTARIRWTLGRAAGTQSLRIRAAGVPVRLVATARARPSGAANVMLDERRGMGRTTIGRQVVATVTDEYGNPVPDARITFSSRSGTVAPARTVTDASGRATVRWSPGTRGEEHTVTATVRGTDVTGSFAMRTPMPRPAAVTSTPARRPSPRPIKRRN